MIGCVRMGMLLFGVAAFAQGNVFPEQAATSYEEQLREDALVSLGDTVRLQHALAKARRGEPIVVGVIGGSITQGSSATSVEKRWANLVAQWWRETFPEVEVTLVNAGIGSTGSDIGAHRAQTDLLDFQPDFVVEEFALNDLRTALAAETLEGLTRQILHQPYQPASIMLFMMKSDGGNSQNNQEPVGYHYELPMVSFRDALWPEVLAGRMEIEDLLADNVHPNDLGHAYAADFVIGLLERVLSELPADDLIPTATPTPEPLNSDVFEFASFRNYDTLVPIRSQGWTAVNAWNYGYGWQASIPGSVLECEVEGSCIGLVILRASSPALGIVEARVDGGDPVQIDGYSSIWGWWTSYHVVARGLDSGPHVLEVTLLSETNPLSGGHYFAIYSIASAGRYGDDSDADGLPDQWEVYHALNQYDATGANGAQGDPDNDMLTNALEYVHGTDPNDSDSDDDSVADGLEVSLGTNPLDFENPTHVPLAFWPMAIGLVIAASLKWRAFA